LVSTKIGVKLADVQIVESKPVTRMTDCKPGSVTCKNRCQVLAPSISAASYNSELMACIPAMKFIVQNGVPAQTMTTIKAGTAIRASVKK